MTEVTGLKRQRLVGAAVMIALTLAIVFIQWQRASRHEGSELDCGFNEMAAAVDGPRTDLDDHLRSAERCLSRATGLVVLEPRALVALAIVHELPHKIAQALPTEPPADGLTADTAQRYTSDLLAHGRPDLALPWLAAPASRRVWSTELATLQAVAQAWQAGRKPAAAKFAKPQ